ncbi:MAG: T9SS type A sorting domain-containing protein [Bacteroidia bacterium]|nr:T9SS type A sorting domain-containing protein [Bacteroidia bacterium]
MKAIMIQVITAAIVLLLNPGILPGQNFEGGGYQGGTYGSGGIENFSGIPDPAANFLNNFSVFPNPIDGRSTIKFVLAAPAKTELSVFDINNRKVKVIVKPADLPPGDYIMSWDGSDDNGNLLANGLYFCRMTQGSKILWKKIVLIGR